jgi:hypothetical protein
MQNTASCNEHAFGGQRTNTHGSAYELTTYKFCDYYT